MRSLVIMQVIMTCAISFAGEVFDDSKIGNYMLCEVSISKNGEEISKHLVTTYHPRIKAIDFTAYHYATTSASNCVSQAFRESFNERHLYVEKDSHQYVDLCYKIGNGLEEGRDGYAEFYIALRSTKIYHSFNYLNRTSPLTLSGSMRASKIISKYRVDADCQNTMLSPTDSLWDDINRERFTF